MIWFNILKSKSSSQSTFFAHKNFNAHFYQRYTTLEGDFVSEGVGSSFTQVS